MVCHNIQRMSGSSAKARAKSVAPLTNAAQPSDNGDNDPLTSKVLSTWGYKARAMLNKSAGNRIARKTSHWCERPGNAIC